MPTSFTAMTWNLENLFGVGHEFGPDSQDDYDRKLSNLATTIVAIAPDVLAVQEVGVDTQGDPTPFADLQGRLNGLYPFSRLSTHPDSRGIRVGFLSRLELTDIEELDAFPQGSLLNVPANEDGTAVVDSLGRGALKATIALDGGQRVHLVTAHLKSKLITYPGNRFQPKDEAERARGSGLALFRRAAEAVGLRVYVNQLVTGNTDPVIVLGDLNDGPDAVTTEIIEGPPDFSLQRADLGDDVRLYNLASYISPERRYSRIYHKKRELIDHILVSHELIFKLVQADSHVEPIGGVGEDPRERRDALFPDHAPLFARFEL